MVVEGVGVIEGVELEVLLGVVVGVGVGVGVLCHHMGE